jgi:hypothetical protein
MMHSVSALCAAAAWERHNLKIVDSDVTVVIRTTSDSFLESLDDLVRSNSLYCAIG